jgi:hypothetical protein
MDEAVSLPRSKHSFRLFLSLSLSWSTRSHTHLQLQADTVSGKIGSNVLVVFYWWANMVRRWLAVFSRRNALLFYGAVPVPHSCDPTTSTWRIGLQLCVCPTSLSASLPLPLRACNARCGSAHVFPAHRTRASLFQSPWRRCALQLLFLYY